MKCASCIAQAISRDYVDEADLASRLQKLFKVFNPCISMEPLIRFMVLCCFGIAISVLRPHDIQDDSSFPPWNAAYQLDFNVHSSKAQTY